MRRWSESRTVRRISRLHLVLVAGLLCVRAGFEYPIPAEEIQPAGKEEKDHLAPIGQFITISGAVDDGVLGKVSRAALKLQTRARQEKRRGVLVLEILPGSSPFHQVQGLAKFLSNEVPSLTTVAFISETVTGNHVVLALACKEIILKPEAELGDISLGTPLAPTEQAFVVDLVNSRHNPKVTEPLARAMFDRQIELLWLQVELGKKPNTSRESRVVLRSGYEELAKTGAEIQNPKTLKNPGDPGIFSGERARGYNILVMKTAQSREELATLYHLPRESMREDSATGEAPRGMIIRIDSLIDPVLEQFVMRQIDRAVAAGVNLLILQIDSDAGKTEQSLALANMIADLNDRKVRAIAYVPRKALSGAAAIAAGCDEIYLHPAAQIGNAATVQMGRGGRLERINPKELAFLKDALKALAQRKNRPAGLLQAMADKDLPVFQVAQNDGQVSFMTEEELHESNGQWIKGEQVPETRKGELLVLDGNRAHELRIAEAPVKDFDELKSRLGVPHEMTVPVSVKTWVDTLIFKLNTAWATALLFVVGLVCIYLELHLPSGLFGICACVCFGLFFWSRFLGGTAGWLEVVLFLLGAGCLAIEIFVVPGFGVFGVSGVLLCVCSLVLASQTFIIPATAGDLKELTRSLATLSSAVVGVVVLAALFSRYLPSIPLFNAMILNPPGADELHSSGPRLRPDLAGGAAFINPVLERDQSLEGRQGTAMTVLRPAGKAQIGSDFVDVVSEGPFISAGRKIEVVSVSGNRVVVREIA